MSNKGLVTAAKPKVGGAIWTALIGTTPPADATTALPEDYISLGYCSEDGLTNNGEISTEAIKAWGGDTVLNTQTDKIDEFGFTLIEGLNVDVLKFVHVSSNVTGTLDEGIAISVNSKEHESCVIVVEMIMNGGVLKRIVIPSGVITAVDEISYGDSEAVGYAVTIAAQPDESGNTHYEYIKKSK